MNTASRPIFLGRHISIKKLRDYILDDGLADVDTILMSQADFDELALEHLETYKERLPDPFLLLGVLIKEDSSHAARQGSVIVIENDTESIRVKPPELVDPDRIIYRCGYCGDFVDERGRKLDDDEYRNDAAYLSKFGREVNVVQRVGYCCRKYYYPDLEEASARNAPEDIAQKADYSSVEGKDLMELTDEDFERLGLSKVETPEFEKIYACPNPSHVKIYFTPNETTYSLRGHRLKEYQEITSTEQLIEAIREWRKEA